MPRIYARLEGSAIRIDNYGEATFETPAVVPAVVAKELAKDARLRIESDDEKPVHGAVSPSSKHVVSDLATDVSMTSGGAEAGFRRGTKGKRE